MTTGKPRSAPGEDPVEFQRGIDYASFFPEENLLDALLSSEDEESDPELETTPRGRVNSDATASPGMSVAGRKMGRLQVMKLQASKPSTSRVSQEDSSQPIAQRTRATRGASGLPDQDVDLDDVLFDIDNEELEEIENFGKVFDDDEEYQKFLASLQHFEELDKTGDGHGSAGGQDGQDGQGGQGVGNTGEGDADEDDDDDFIEELQEMIAEEVDEVLGGQRGLFQADQGLSSEMPIEKISFLFRKRGRGSLQKRKPRNRAPKELRRSLRVENQRTQKRLYAARLVNKRTQNHMNNGIHMPSKTQELAALAALMGVTMVESQVQAMNDSTPLPSEFRPGMFDEMANAVRWKPPLPSTIRKAHAKLKREEGPGGGDASGPELNPELRYHIQLSMFDPLQRQRLVMQIMSHMQMCFQSLCLAAIQKEEASLVEQLKNTLQSSMEGLFPVLKAITREDLNPWEEGIQSLIEMVERDEVGEVNDVVQVPDVSKNQKRPTQKRPRKIRPGDIAGHVWSHLPYPLMRKLAKIRSCFDPTWEPKRSSNRFIKQQKFTPAEDNLLAWGIRKHTYNWQKIREDLLPHRSEKDIFLRKKNSVSATAKQGNIIAEAVRGITMPLTHAEIELLNKATAYYGKDKKGHYLHWEVICRDYLPYRTPKVLSMLWSEWKKQHDATGDPTRQTSNP